MSKSPYIITIYSKMESLKTPRSIKERFFVLHVIEVHINSRNHLYICEVICTGGRSGFGR